MPAHRVLQDIQLAQETAALTAQASQTLTLAQSGLTFFGASGVTFTLPAIESGMLGCSYIFVNTIALGGITISPNSADAIYGLGLNATPTDNKDYINTAATARIGDCLEIVCDGTNWCAIRASGTWARET